MARKPITEKQREALDKGRRQCTPENAKDRQAKSVVRRKENRLAKEILAEELAKGNRKQQGLDALAKKYAEGDLAAVKLVQDILEEADNRQQIDFSIKVDFGDE